MYIILFDGWRESNKMSRESPWKLMIEEKGLPLPIRGDCFQINLPQYLKVPHPPIA